MSSKSETSKAKVGLDDDKVSKHTDSDETVRQDKPRSLEQFLIGKAACGSEAQWTFGIA